MSRVPAHGPPPAPLDELDEEDEEEDEAPPAPLDDELLDDELLDDEPLDEPVDDEPLLVVPDAWVASTELPQARRKSEARRREGQRMPRF